MKFMHAAKNRCNRLLAPFNVRIDSLTRTTQETARIDRLEHRGYFGRPVFPVLTAMTECTTDRIARKSAECREDLRALMAGRAEPGCYEPDNEYFTGTDAQILYLMIRSWQPRNIVEIGSGHSTRVIRQAIVDEKLEVRHLAIDPYPRTSIQDMVDQVILMRLEDIEASAREEIFTALEPGDVVFIDSSHEASIGSDVVHLFCNVLPSLPAGVLVHVHDVFLPFDYPADFARGMPNWNEQYLLQVFIEARSCRILWPGYYLQRCRPEALGEIHFSAPSRARAQSFWFVT